MSMDNTEMNTADEELPKRAIVLPLLERPLFPETFTTLLIGRPQDVQIISKVIEGDGCFVALLQNQGSGLEDVGTLARVSRYIKLPNSCIHVFVSTLQRVRIEGIDIDGQITYASFSPDPDTPVSSAKEAASYVRVLRESIMSLSQTTNMFSFASDVNVSNIDDPSLLSFYAASAINAPGTFLQEILETRNAIRAYDEVRDADLWSVDDFLRIHGTLMFGCVEQEGFRTHGVCIAEGDGRVVYVAPGHDQVEPMVRRLFDWCRDSDYPAPITAAIAHYYIESVHPFPDGNGRIGRLWH